MSLVEEVHSLEIPPILDERRRHPFPQLAALVDVIATWQGNFGAVEPEPLTVILCHALCIGSGSG